MDVRVLGPIEVVGDKGPIHVGGRGPRRLLAILAARAPEPVSVDRLTESLWADADRPENAVATLRTYVSRLRSALHDGEVIRTSEASYYLNLDRAEVDALRFELLIDEAARYADTNPAKACDLLENGLNSWRGSAFGEFADEEALRADALRLEELRLVAIEQRIDALLDLGTHATVVAELERLVSEHPMRERFRAQLMIALHRSGRTAEASLAYQEYRTWLADEMGLDPSPELRELDVMIISGDPRVDAPAWGRSLRGYQLGDKIGEGAFGAIYRAVQPSVGREVAIKVIRPELADDPEFIRRFDFEAQLVARLEHPHVVPLYDYWREPGGAYLVMRWIRGGSVEDLLARDPWPVERVLRLVDQVGGALAAAHDSGVVHRDVKPGNILVDERQDTYLTDFGIALEPESEGMPSGLTSASSIAYRSPELSGTTYGVSSQEATPRSDLYSFALVVTELLAGRPLFGSESPVGNRTNGQPVRSFLEDRSEIPEAAIDELARATSSDPEDRQPSIRDFTAAFLGAVEIGGSGAQVDATTQASAGLGTGPFGSSVVLHELDQPNPYKGLRAFLEADADDFFGRESLVAEILARVETTRMVAVVGPSGSGKSSVVRAGVVPSLRAGELIGSDDWFVATVVPGANPFEELETALLRIAVDPPSRLLEQLRDGEHGLTRVVERILPDSSGELLLVIDQFEELFTLTDSGTRNRFLAGLAKAVERPASRLRVILTLRADFYDRPLQDPVVGPFVQTGTVAVVPLTGDELEHAIVGPSRRVGVKVPGDLVADMVAEVVDQPGTLPLLQYTLTELFDRRDDSSLTLDAYRELGGVAGALAGRAEEIYEAIDSEGRDAVRQLFSRLIVPGAGTEDTRRRALRSELRGVPDLVIDAYGGARLLSFDRDPVTREPTIEVAHEALIREWPRLRRWIDEDRDALRILSHLEESARAWEAGGRDSGDLYRGARLEAALDWADAEAFPVSDLEEQFLAASRASRDQEVAAERQRVIQQARQNRRLRLALAVIAVALVGAVVAGILAFQQSRRADDEAHEATAARSAAETRRLASDASQLVDTNHRLALLLAAEAFQREPGSTTLGGLQRVLAGTGNFLGYLGGDGDWRDVAFVRNGRIAGIDANGLSIFDLASAEILLRVGIDEAEAVEVAPDGRTAAVTAGSEVFLVNLESGGLLGESLQHPSKVVSVVHSPDGSVLATGDWDGTVRLYDATDGELRHQFIAHPERGVDDLEGVPDGLILGIAHQPETVPIGVTSMGFSEDGTRLVTTGLVVARLWDVDRAELLTNVHVERPTADGDRRVLTPPVRADLPAHRPGMIRIGTAFTFLYLDEETGEVVNEIEVAARAATVSLASIDSDIAFGRSLMLLGFFPGSQAVVIPADGASETSVVDTLLPGSPSVALSPDEKTIAYAADGGIGLWALDGRRLIAGSLPTDPTWFSQAHFSPDAKTLALTSGAFVGAELWDVSGSTPRPLGPAGDEVDYLQWVSPATMLTWDFEKNLLIGRDAKTLEPNGVSYGVVTSVMIASSPDGRLLAVGTGGTRDQDDDAVIRVFELDTGEPVVVLEDLVGIAGENGLISSVSFSPDGRRLVASTGNGAAAVWNTETWTQADPPLSGGAGSVVRARYTPDGRWLVTLSDDGTITLRDPRTLQPDGPPIVGGTEGIAGPRPGPFFTDDGRHMITVADGQGRLWDLAARVQVGGTFPSDPGRAPAASNDGRLLTTFDDDHVLIWDLDIDGWLDTACRAAGRNLTLDEWAQFGPTGEPYRATCPRWTAAPGSPGPE